MYIDIKKLPKDTIGIEITDDNKIIVYRKTKSYKVISFHSNKGDEKPNKKKISIDKIKDVDKYREWLISHNKKLPKWLLNNLY